MLAIWLGVAGFETSSTTSLSSLVPTNRVVPDNASALVGNETEATSVGLLVFDTSRTLRLSVRPR